ncbi:MAG: type II secretion system F family protein [Caldicoprobacterales bacterium]
MEIFYYEVVDKYGNILNGSIDAEHEVQAYQRLKDKGYMIIQIKKKDKFNKLFLSFFRNKRVTIGDKVLFSRQLSAMINVGIPITRALYTLSKQTHNPTFRNVLEDITRNIESGISVSSAFASYPSIFNDLYIGMIKAGEVGGNLGETLTRLASQMQKEKVLKDNLRSATIYPFSVMLFSVIIVLAMLVFLVPIFEGFFPENIEIPFISRIVIFLSHSLRNFWYIWLAIMMFLVGTILIYFRTDRGSTVLEKIWFNVPAFGSLYHKTIITRFARTFSTLFSSGIPVIQALETSGKSTGSKLLSQVIHESIVEIEEGKKIGETFEKKWIFPPMVSYMITVGEETGSLPSLLDRVAEFYEDEVATISKGISSMIEPILLIFVGILVGVMLISLYLPIFTIITQTNIS